nr:MAG TPA_asm: Transcription factor grauzone, transcription regulation, treble-clef zinc.0A [Caudoviricetes sp.]
MGIVFPKKEWINVDICKECYQKLLFKSSVKEKVNDEHDNC